MRTKNKVISKNKFKSRAVWTEKAGPYFVIPTLMIEKDLDIGIDVKIDRYTWVWGYKRWRWDVGTYTPLPTGDIVWNKIGLEDFSKWAKVSYNKKWGKYEIENIIKNKPFLKDIIVESGLTKHYTRILISREIMRNENGISSDKIYKEANGKTRMVLDALTQHIEEENQKIDPLDQLGSKIMSSSQNTTKFED